MTGSVEGALFQTLQFSRTAITLLFKFKEHRGFVVQATLLSVLASERTEIHKE